MFGVNLLSSKSACGGADVRCSVGNYVSFNLTRRNSKILGGNSAMGVYLLGVKTSHLSASCLPFCACEM